MNAAQCWAAKIGALIILLTCLIPPWQGPLRFRESDSVVSTREWAYESGGWDYGFLFVPPKTGTVDYESGGYGLFRFAPGSPHIDSGRLLVEWGLVGALTVLIVVGLADSPNAKAGRPVETPAARKAAGC
jgi:hypothetical protein